MSTDSAPPAALLLQQMQSVRLFAEQDRDDLHTALACAQRLQVPAGTELAHEGADQHDFCVLLRGERVVTQALGEGLAPLEVGLDPAALRALVRQHRLVVDRRFPHYVAPMRISAQERARWHALFDVAQGAVAPPFGFHSTAGTLVLMKVVTDVGVNFRKQLHLRSEMTLSLLDVEPGVGCRLRARLADIQVLRGDRVVLVVDSRLNDDTGHLVRGFRDFFGILNLQAHHVAAPKASKRFGRLDVAELRDAARRKSKLTGRDGVRRSRGPACISSASPSPSLCRLGRAWRSRSRTATTRLWTALARCWPSATSPERPQAQRPTDDR
jgi:hypothetical protein